MTNRIDAIRNAEAEETIRAGASLAWLLDVTNETTASYKELQRVLAEHHCMSSGYDTRTNQTVVKVRPPRRDPAALEKCLQFLIEQVVPILASDPKEIGIFENTLSESGVYSLVVHDQSVDLVLTRWRRPTTLETFPDLRTALTYIQEHHYYGD
ncbi:hypothetical protein P409_00620 [Inquilinus limosus MP06]|uniref:Uncharacterized protein n=2 Tax=Inquilinus limosus TaxID=171674 RepID=A0A0A0DDJ5_9PROT|nr:hypothetical protein P409_00620 [Inquilinus limosus MP06]